MINYEDLKEYVVKKEKEGLISITLIFGMDKEEEELVGSLEGSPISHNIKIAEVYKIYDNEERADELITQARNNQNFYSCSKTYKEPKFNKKTNEEVSKGYWLVKIGYKRR